jgi:intracellular sulfur oxidation DsrE/DsrF family protein
LWSSAAAGWSIFFGWLSIDIPRRKIMLAHDQPGIGIDNMDIRRRFALALGLATAVAVSSKTSSAATEQASESPQADQKDAWLDEGGKRHRMVFDTLSATGIGQGLNFARNFFEANRDAYGISPNEVSVVIIARHFATPLMFNDHIWDKYGDYLVDRIKLFDPRTKAPPRVNLYNAELANNDLPNGKTRLADLQKLGARFAVCSTATKNAAGAIAKNVNGDADAIFKELTNNLVSETARMVPAGISTLNRAQEHGYTFSYCG